MTVLCMIVLLFSSMLEDFHKSIGKSDRVDVYDLGDNCDPKVLSVSGLPPTKTALGTISVGD